MRSGCGSGIERLPEVSPQVLDVLAANAQPQEVLRRLVLARPARAPVDQCLHAAEARCMDDQACRAADSLRILRLTAQLGREQRSETAHLLARQVPPRRIRKSRISDSRDLRMTNEPVGQLARRALRSVDPDRQRAQAAQSQKRLERARDRPAERPPAWDLLSEPLVSRN